MTGDGEQGQHLLGMLKKAYSTEFIGRHYYVGLYSMACYCPVFGGKQLHGAETSGQQVAHHLGTFGHEGILPLTLLLLFQRPHEFYLVLANHGS